MTQVLTRCNFRCLCLKPHMTDFLGDVCITPRQGLGLESSCTVIEVCLTSHQDTAMLNNTRSSCPRIDPASSVYRVEAWDVFPFPAGDTE